MTVRFYAENYDEIREVEVAPAVTAEHGLSPMQNAGGLMVLEMPREDVGSDEDIL